MTLLYNGDENSSPPSVADVGRLAEINPIHHTSVFCRKQNMWYDFNVASKEMPNGVAVVKVGSYPKNHPTHGGLAFMPGNWEARSSNK